MTAHGRIRARVLRVACALALGPMILHPASAGAAKPAAKPKCQVINAETRVRYSSLQAAVNKAASGAALTVLGTCAGSTILSKDVTITGENPSGRYTASTLTGDGTDVVLANDLATVSVSITNLTVTGGGGAVEGGGIRNAGTLTLNGVTVTQNSAVFGGGILNMGRLFVTNSVISNNTASYFGGGLENDRTGEMVVTNTRVRFNIAKQDGGGIWNEGQLTVNGFSAVSDNLADQLGGGIASYGLPNPTVSLTDHAVVEGNHGGGGCGVYNGESSQLSMSGNSEIAYNDCGVVGGGGILNESSLGYTGVVVGQNVFGNMPNDVVG